MPPSRRAQIEAESQDPMSALVNQDNRQHLNRVGADVETLDLSSELPATGIDWELLNGPIRQADTTELVGAGPGGLAALFMPLFNSKAEIVVVDMDDLTRAMCPVDSVAPPLLMNPVTSGVIQPRRVVSHEFALSETSPADDLFGQAMRKRALNIVILND